MPARHRRPSRISLGQPHEAPCAVLDRRSQARARFYALQLGQSERAEGRAGAALGHGQLRLAQPVPRQRQSRRRAGADLRHADDAKSRRGRGILRPRRRVGGLPRRLLLRDRPAAQGRALSRRQAHHPRGRDLLIRRHQEGLPQPRFLLQGRVEGGKDRRPPGHLHLLGQGQPRAADHHRRPTGAAEAFPRGRRRQRRAARFVQVHARSPLGLGPLPHQGGRCRPLDQLRARQGLVGQGPARRQRPVELRRAQVRLLPRPCAGVRGFQVRAARLLAGKQRQGMGDRLRLRRRQAWAGQAGKAADKKRRLHAVVCLQRA